MEPWIRQQIRRTNLPSDCRFTSLTSIIGLNFMEQLFLVSIHLISLTKISIIHFLNLFQWNLNINTWESNTPVSVIFHSIQLQPASSTKSVESARQLDQIWWASQPAWLNSLEQHFSIPFLHHKSNRPKIDKLSIDITIKVKIFRQITRKSFFLFSLWYQTTIIFKRQRFSPRRLVLGNYNHFTYRIQYTQEQATRKLITFFSQVGSIKK